MRICDLKDAKKLQIDLKYALNYLQNKKDLDEKSAWIKHCNWLKEKYSTCDGEIPQDKYKFTHFEAAKMLSDAFLVFCPF